MCLHPAVCALAGMQGLTLPAPPMLQPGAVPAVTRGPGRAPDSCAGAADRAHGGGHLAGRLCLLGRHQPVHRRQARALHFSRCLPPFRFPLNAAVAEDPSAETHRSSSRVFSSPRHASCTPGGFLCPIAPTQSHLCCFHPVAFCKDRASPHLQAHRCLHKEQNALCTSRAGT